VIGGYTPGNPFDALIVGYHEGEQILYAAKVRNGFAPLVRREVATKFKGLQTNTCPFANLYLPLQRVPLQRVGISPCSGSDQRNPLI
jgi:ATP-dependent DNA ligase